MKKTRTLMDMSILVQIRKKVKVKVHKTQNTKSCWSHQRKGLRGKKTCTFWKMKSTKGKRMKGISNRKIKWKSNPLNKMMQVALTKKTMRKLGPLINNTQTMIKMNHNQKTIKIQRIRKIRAVMSRTKMKQITKFTKPSPYSKKSVTPLPSLSTANYNQSMQKMKPTSRPR